MFKVLNAYPHGILDYMVGLLLILAPWIFQFADTSTTATWFMVIAGVAVVGLSLFTNYPLGAIKKIPFKVHGVIEAIAAVVVLFSPWLFDFAYISEATGLAVIVGVGWLLVVALTDYTYESYHVYH